VDWNSYSPDPVSRSEVLIGRRFMQQHGEDAMRAIVTARRWTIGFSILGAIVLACWAMDLWGTAAGIAATTLWCVSPTVLGHGALITPDVGAAATFVVAVYCTARWIRTPTWGATAWMSLAITLAISAKTTNWLVFPVALLLWCWQQKPAMPHESARRRQLLQFSLASFTAIFLFNSLYGFQGVGQRLGKYAFASQTLGDTIESRGNRFRGTLLGAVPIPLPSDFVSGIDIQKRDIERGLRVPGWQSYLYGTWRQGGWPYFYLAAMLVKESLGTLVLAVAAVLTHLRARTLFTISAIWLPAMAIIGLVSSQSAFTMHYRYVLPALPFLYLFGSSLVVHPQMLVRIASWALVGCSAIGSLSAYPHSLSHFNWTAGGGNRGEMFLVDSNIDWGQDLLFLKQWLRSHPEAASLKMAYFGSFDPRDLGVAYQIPKALPKNVQSRPVESQKGLGPQPGWYAVSVNYKQGCLMPVPDDHGIYRYFGEPVFSYFGEFEPITRIGGSIEVFHLTGSEVNRVRAKLGLPSIE